MLRLDTWQEILDTVWGQDVVVDPRTVDNFVSNLKKKLGWTSTSGFTTVNSASSHGRHAVMCAIEGLRWIRRFPRDSQRKCLTALVT